MMNEPLREYIEIPDLLFAAALREMNPIYDPPNNVRKKEEERHKNSVCDVPRDLIEAMIAYLREGAEGPDYSVGIYGNGWAELAAELNLALEGKLTCRNCGGEGINWDEAQWKREIERIAKETGRSVGEIEEEYGDWPGNIKCETCDGAGIVRIGKES
jgi:hypothetical protein